MQQILGDREVIWLWGHEHRLAVYGKFQSKNGIKAFGRCIGHGGMPVELGKIKSSVMNLLMTPGADKVKDYKLVFFDRRANKGQRLEKLSLGTMDLRY